MRDLLTDLKNIPKNAAIRKVNELVKRVRLAKAHMCIIGHLKKEMPSMFGKDKVQAKLLGNLEDHFLKVHRTHQLPVGDFPDVTKFRKTMEGHELTKFPKFDQKQARAAPPLPPRRCARASPFAAPAALAAPLPLPYGHARCVRRIPAAYLPFLAPPPGARRSTCSSRCCRATSRASSRCSRRKAPAPRRR